MGYANQIKYSGVWSPITHVCATEGARPAPLEGYQTMRSSHFWRAFRLAVLVSLGSACASSRPQLATIGKNDVPLAVIGATLWDGTGRAPVSNSVVLIRGERILCASSVGECTIPTNARIIDGRGRWLIPGLIDTHVHLLFLTKGSAGYWLADDLRDLLARGVTTVRDMGNDPAALLARTSAVEMAPRVYAMQLVAGFRFFYMRGSAVRRSDGSTLYRQPPALVMQARGWRPMLFNPGDNADSLIAQAKAVGASGLKLYANLDTLEIRALVDAAHRAGMSVWGHGWLQPTSALEQSAAGADGIVHASLLAGELFGRRARDSMLSDVALLRAIAEAANASSGHDDRILRALDSLARRGTFLEPTLDVSMRSLAHDADEHGMNPSIQGRYARAAVSFGMAVTREAVRRGVRIVAGTDHVSYGPYRDRASLVDELVLLVDSVGLKPSVALLAATRNAAQALGPAVAQQLGIVEAGRYADLVLLTANPLEDLRNLERVEWVMKGGHLFRPETLRSGVAMH